MSEHWINRDVRIASELAIDPVYVNWISKAIRRDGRYDWTKIDLNKLGVVGLSWETVTDQEIKDLAVRLSEKS